MSDDQPSDEYRFGFTREQIIAEIVDHKGLIRDGCYVPTQNEVATWPADRLWGIMLGWWHESPASLIPNDAQVAESVAVLRARPDADSEPFRGSSRKRHCLRTVWKTVAERRAAPTKVKGRVVEPKVRKAPAHVRLTTSQSRETTMKTASAPAAPSALDAIPEPPIHVQRLMLALTVAVDGFVDQHPHDFHPALQHSFVMPQANVLVAGTRCSAPLLVREVKNIARLVDRDAIIVRAAVQSEHTTFDILLRETSRPLLAYRLWMRQPMGAAWLVPTAGERTHIRLDPLGLELSLEPPYTDEVDRHRGLKAGSKFLSVAATGWF